MAPKAGNEQVELKLGLFKLNLRGETTVRELSRGVRVILWAVAAAIVMLAFSAALAHWNEVSSTAIGAWTSIKGFLRF